MSDGGLKLLRATLEYSLTLPRPAHRADVSVQRRHRAAHKTNSHWITNATVQAESDAAWEAGVRRSDDEIFEELS